MIILMRIPLFENLLSLGEKHNDAFVVLQIVEAE